MTDKPDETAWRPVEDLESGFLGLAHDGARKAAQSWRTLRQRLADPGTGHSSMDVWFRAMRRAFVIETGRIAGLYTLRDGVTEMLLAEGFDNARVAHADGGTCSSALPGLLAGQEAALDSLLARAAQSQPLTATALREWHALLTGSQPDPVIVDAFGNRAMIPLRSGQWRIQADSGRRCCPPPRIDAEIGRFLVFHRGHSGLGLAPETEAAWLHREFCRIRPFQVGNGRVARLLVAFAYARAGEIPPVIPSEAGERYAGALDLATRGDFGALVRFLGDLAAAISRAACARAEIILGGDADYRHANGGITSRGVYYPPDTPAPPN